MTRIFLLALLFIPFDLLAQPDLWKPQLELINTKIDSIEITGYLLNEPNDRNFNTKFKVLEFWATWCKPCLKAVPHLNRLQKMFNGRNIVFLSFTYETAAKTRETLKKVKFETIVVTDTSRTIHKKLRVQYNNTMPLPRIVLIDDENRIVWYGNPDKLTPIVIEKFLRKEAPATGYY